MNKKEKTTFTFILLRAIPLIFFFIAFLFLKNERRDLILDTVSAKAELDNFRASQSVGEERIDEREARYFWALSRYRGTENFNLFGQTVKEELLKANLTIIRYERQNIDSEEYLQFTVEGHSIDFFTFLNRFSSLLLAYRIPYFHMESDTRGSRIIFLIGFDFLDDVLKADLPLTDGFDWSDETPLRERSNVDQLATAFSDRPVEVKKKSAPTTVITPVPYLPQPRSFKYVGHVSVDNYLKFYIKDSITGSLITIPSQGWDLIEQDDALIRFNNNGTNYEVNIR